MQLKTRERVMRMFLASLLRSDLSIRELKELASELSGQDFLHEFGGLLHETIMNLTTMQSLKHLPYPSDRPDEAAYEVIQRRRIPKRKLIDTILSISPKLYTYDLSTNATVRDILSTFFSAATQSEADIFMNFLGVEHKGDAYLKGIIQRR